MHMLDCYARVSSSLTFKMTNLNVYPSVVGFPCSPKARLGFQQVFLTQYTV